MGWFFGILTVFFVLALIVIGTVCMMAYRGLRRVQRTIQKGKEQIRKQREDFFNRQNPRRQPRRIVPREYGEDVEYEVLALSGSEEFLVIAEVLAYRGESQITDAEYVVIMTV